MTQSAQRVITRDDENKFLQEKIRGKGEENLLRITVNNAYTEEVYPQMADFTFSTRTDMV